MSVCLIICLVGIICQADGIPAQEGAQATCVPEGTLLAQAEPLGLDSPDEASRTSLAQQRILTKRILQEQTRRWREQAREIPPHLAQQALEEKPELSKSTIGTAELSKQSLELEKTAVVYYTTASEKVSVPEVARILKKMAEQHARQQEMLVGLEG